MTIYCVGRNYLKHIEELSNATPDEPVIFLKSDNAFRGLNTSGIKYPYDDLNYELEIVLKIGKSFSLNDRVKLIDISEIALGIDLTRRKKQQDLKNKGLPWTTAKSFLGAAIVGDFYPFEKYSKDEISFWLKINGELKQQSSSRFMLNSFLDICDFINSFSPLEKGDLVFTGTPEGVGPIKMGDQIEFQLANEDIEYGRL